MSLGLSVHQGRGRSHAEAKLGAIMEGIEGHAAESFVQVAHSASWDGLATSDRYGELRDFARDGRHPVGQAEPVAWSEAYCIEGRRHLVPFACVSIDLTTLLGTGFERSTNALAAGFNRDAARMAALLELIERDAITTWKQIDFSDRMRTTISLDGVPGGWLEPWRDRLSAAGVRLQCYWVPSISGTPVFAAELSDLGKGTKAYRAVEGTGAHPIPELALLRAVSEAIQGRCAFIAGSRDDMMPDSYQSRAGAVQMVFGLPMPSGMEPIAFAAVELGSQSLEDICLAIERAGYGPVVFVDVGQVGAVHVVKAFAAGLANRRRPRRAMS